MGWGTEAINHKKQKLSWDSILTVKDYTLKKCSWFYKFEDIFYNYLSINPPLIIKFRQPPKRDEAAIKEDNLRGYDFDPD